MGKYLLDDKKYTIKEMPINERPREKLIAYGPESLSNAELIAVIIRTGQGNSTAIDLANRVIGLDKRGIVHLAEASIDDLKQINGIGECKAAQIIAALELAKRIKKVNPYENIRILEPYQIAQILIEEMKFLTKEHFNIVLLDTKNQVISIENISIGSLNSSIVHPREVFKEAIKKSSNSIILAHNHPSGDVTPSDEDITITHRLIKSGDIIGIKVIDHIIVGNENYLSMKEKNYI
ncbi:MAG TPA: DNA repair protein RadC [Soehngenia sp.]|nr:DNA repair protein RadC [Soehngenia sp.]HPP31316.1 DNA repair protein RadC [Soehngenia sp.]